MRKVASVLACLACAGHGRRVQAPTEQLASLLSALDTAEAFNPSAGAVRPAVRPGAQKRSSAPLMPAAIDSKLPSVEIDFGFPPEKVNVADRVKGKKVIMVGLPGAFTPT